MKNIIKLGLASIIGVSLINNKNENQRSISQSEQIFTKFHLEYIKQVNSKGSSIKVILNDSYKSFLGGKSWIAIYKFNNFNSGVNYDEKIKNFISWKYISESTQFNIDSNGAYIAILFGDDDYDMILDSYYFYKESNKLITDKSFNYYSNKYYEIGTEDGLDKFWLDKRKINPKLPLDQLLVVGISGQYINNVMFAYQTAVASGKSFNIIDLLPVVQGGIMDGSVFINLLKGNVFAGVFVNKPTKNPNLTMKSNYSNWEKYKLYNGIDSHTSLILNRISNEPLFPEISFGSFKGNNKYLIVVVNTFGTRDFRTGMSVNINFDTDLYTL